jgi:hypothetical protein
VRLRVSEGFEGGGPTLRGFQYRQFRGDTSVEGHAEYHLPVAGFLGVRLRALGCYDTMALWFRDRDSVPTAGGAFRSDRPDGTLRTFVPAVNAAGVAGPPLRGWTAHTGTTRSAWGCACTWRTSTSRWWEWTWAWAWRAARRRSMFSVGSLTP